MGTVGDRAFALDAAAIALVSVAICAASHSLAFMTALVPSVLAARFAIFAVLSQQERGGASLAAELGFFVLCTLVGAFNDWSSVVRHEIYAYTVPSYFPELSTIPLWMLLFWGMILRFLATLFRWHRLAPPPGTRDDVFLPGRRLRSRWLKIGIELALVAATRQLVYRHFDAPLLSWLPFAVALALFALLLRPDRHDRLLLGLFALGGPAIEVLYIQVGHLHRYDLGWIAGVPLWIALWWLLAALIWKDLSGRLQSAFARALR